MESLLRHIKSLCEEDVVDDYDSVLDEIEARFDYLARLAPPMKICPLEKRDEMARRQTAMRQTQNSCIRS
jgi:hypothetical protein